MQRLNVKALTLALGFSWAICVLFAGWAAIFGWGAGFVEIMSSMYIGYEASFIGGLVGAVWGFVDGAIAGLLISFLYNFFSSKL